MTLRALSAAPRRAALALLPLLALGCLSNGGQGAAAPGEPAASAEAEAAPKGEGETPVAQEGDAAEKEAEGTEAKEKERRPTQSELRAEANRVIDDWHQAASVADRDRYMDHFSLDAVFLGTDPDERWDYASFAVYVDKYFSPPYNGWTFVPSDRKVMLGLNSELAWFDEKLASKKYGTVRGTGVLRLVGDTWKLSHYSMTLAVPNGAMDAVREAIVDYESVSR